MHYSVAIFPLLLSHIFKSIIQCSCEYEEELTVIVKFFSQLFLTLQFLQTSLILIKIDNLVIWYWRQVFCGYWIMISILAGGILITFLFSLSTLEDICQKKNWVNPQNIACKRSVFVWTCMIFIISLFVLSIQFLLGLYDYFSSDYDLKYFLNVCYQCSIWEISLLTFVLLSKDLIIQIFKSVFEDLDQMYSEYEQSFNEEESYGQRKKKILKQVELHGVPTMIQKFTATYFKFKINRKRRQHQIIPKDSNHSFCIDMRQQHKYFEPKIQSQSFFINRSMQKDKSILSQETEDPQEPENPNESYFLCNICFASESDSVFMECGHGGVCLQCANDVWQSTGECYLCRSQIEYVLRYDVKDKNGTSYKLIEMHKPEEMEQKILLQSYLNLKLVKSQENYYSTNEFDEKFDDIDGFYLLLLFIFVYYTLFYEIFVLQRYSL